MTLRDKIIESGPHVFGLF